MKTGGLGTPRVLAALLRDPDINHAESCIAGVRPFVVPPAGKPTAGDGSEVLAMPADGSEARKHEYARAISSGESSSECLRPCAQKISDQMLMDQVQHGHTGAFEQLARRWDGPLLKFFSRAVGDTDTAQDLRQDLYVRLYAHSKTYRPECAFRPWVYAIATNVVRYHIRKLKKTLPPCEKAEPNQSSAVLQIPDSASLADGVAQQKERAHLLRSMLRSLLPKDRNSLILRFFEDLRYGEIARILGVRQTTARLRVYRATKKLRHLIAQRGLTAAELL